MPVQILDCSDVPDTDPSGSGYDCPAAQLMDCQQECLDGKEQACAGLLTARYRGEQVDVELLARQLMFLCDPQHPIACRCLGQLYGKGDGRPQNDSAALQAYESACSGGDGLACVYLAFMLRKGRGAPEGAPRAFELLTSQCEQGLTSACNNLGYWYAEGDFVEQDYERAFNLFLFGCRKGSVHACDSVGEAYEKGWHVAQDLQRAEVCYMLACKYWNSGVSCESAARVRARMDATTTPPDAD